MGSLHLDYSEKDDPLSYKYQKYVRLVTRCSVVPLPSSYKNIRRLDIDDLIILKMLWQGKRVVDIAAILCTTAPGVCHRITKMSDIWKDTGFNIRSQSKKCRVLSPEAIEICKKAAAMLDILSDNLTQETP